jgi:hypothetical protein
LVEDSTTVAPNKEMAIAYRDQIKRYRDLRSASVEQASS